MMSNYLCNNCMSIINANYTAPASFEQLASQGIMAKWIWYGWLLSKPLCPTCTTAAQAQYANEA